MQKKMLFIFNPRSGKGLIKNKLFDIIHEYIPDCMQYKLSDAYNQAYPGVAQYQNETQGELSLRGFTTNLYGRKYYIPINIKTGEVTCFMKGTKCIFIINYDGEYYGEIENHYYKLLELENRDTVMKKESEINIAKKEHHKYIPPSNHPWRKNMMLKY